MKQSVMNWFWYLHSTFHGSTVILWSRLQILVASGWVAMQGVDLSPVVKDPKWLLYWVIGSNLINEMLRRSGAEYNQDGKIK